MSEFSEEKWNNLKQQQVEWQAEFQKSAAYEGLTSELQKISNNITLAFTEFQYKQFEREPKKWTATSLEETLLELFPKELVLKTEDFTKIQPVLTAYFQFLEETAKIKNASTLLKRLEKVAPEMVVRESNPINWSKEKQAAMEQLAKVATTPEAAPKAKLIKNNNISNVKQKIPAGKRQPIHSEKIGRNELCPCGSGKKYKKCCGA